MKKVVYLINSLKENGPNKVLFNMIDGIDKKKYEVYLITFLDSDLNYVRKLEDKVSNIYLINFSKKYQIITNGKTKVQELLNVIQPDIIHSHGILSDIVNATLKTSAKKITTIHDNMFEDYLYTFGKIKGNLFIRWHLHYLKKFDKCVCASFSSYEVLKRHLNNATYVRNSIFKTKIDEDYYYRKRNNIRNLYHIKENDIVYIYAGNLSTLKKSLNLIDYYNKHLKTNEYLFVLGTGPLEKEVKQKITNKNIIFVGFKSNVKDYMCASDIYTSFSSSEGFSISILEALATYNLLLLSDIPSHKEIFNIDNNVYLGDYFSDNFYDIKTKVSNKVKFIKKKDFNDFLSKFLSVSNFMRQYCLIYDEITKK